MIKKNTTFFLFLCVIVLLILPTVSAVRIGTDVVFNTSSSNSSMTFSFDVYTPRFTINSTHIDIFNVSYTNGDFIGNFSTTLNWSEQNNNLDSARYPKLFSSTDALKQISNDLNLTVNMTDFSVPITIACNRISTLTYTTVSGDVAAYAGAGAIALCTSSIITLEDLNIEKNTGVYNTLAITYSVPVPPVEPTGDSQCNLLDFKCIIMNQLIGNPILLIIILMIAWMIVAYMIKLDFETILIYSVPFLLGLGTVIIGFSAIYAFLTVLVGILLAWIFTIIIGNQRGG